MTKSLGMCFTAKSFLMLILRTASCTYTHFIIRNRFVFYIRMARCLFFQMQLKYKSQAFKIQTTGIQNLNFVKSTYSFIVKNLINRDTVISFSLLKFTYMYDFTFSDFIKSETPYYFPGPCSTCNCVTCPTYF